MGGGGTYRGGGRIAGAYAVYMKRELTCVSQLL